VLRFDDGTFCGQMERSERIWGCYLHGLFDGDEFRRWFIDNLRQRVGLQPVCEILAPYDLEIAFDRLAACVRENVDMDGLYRLLKL
jgi:adenosylcobyric acid synthase